VKALSKIAESGFHGVIIVASARMLSKPGRGEMGPNWRVAGCDFSVINDPAGSGGSQDDKGKKARITQQTIENCNTADRQGAQHILNLLWRGRLSIVS